MTDSGAESTMAEGSFLNDDGVEWYRIDNADMLDPFLVNVVSSDDHWMFVSTCGALTAGRREAAHALFPYETDDRLHRKGGRTGPITLIRRTDTGALWEPFAPHLIGGDRTIWKTTVGDRLRFEEQLDGLTFAYTWTTTPEHGLVRQCSLRADAGVAPIEVELLDGLIDVLPAGVELDMMQTSSTLVDAYRRSEYDTEAGLAIYTLESLISDQAIPAESLTANTIWSRGLDSAHVSLCENQVQRFRRGILPPAQHLVTGAKGAFLLSATMVVGPATPQDWMLVADVAQSQSAVVRNRNWLMTEPKPTMAVGEAIDAAHADLIALIAQADGLQHTADRRSTASHFTNVLYNAMRGGTFTADHRVELDAIERFIATRNASVVARFAPLVTNLGAVCEIDDVRSAVRGDPDLCRLVNEYLPLSFSRRHGDPSRPWNTFRIGTRDRNGEASATYEGNWRDIFQNWETLLQSFPGFSESVISKFLNASTRDGFNPYRLTSEGIDWEVPGDDSWANFGYWGDHQIVYLHRLLQVASGYHPGLLEDQLDDQVYSYADVPYRLLPYDRLIEDPKHTLVFDATAQANSDARVAAVGADGKLTETRDGAVHHATLAEKLLVPALSKMSNLVAGAGIWMNTQRPEWNDANNALVGAGVSVVTALHLREYLRFIDALFERSTTSDVRIGADVLAWIDGIEAALAAHASLADPEQIDSAGRRALLDELGAAFSGYRSTMDRPPAPTVVVPTRRLRSLLAAASHHLDAVSALARRDDGLFHTYWLCHFTDGAADVHPLFLMLEGQATALDSCGLTADASADLVRELFASPLYRADQQSFMLQPNEPRPSFLTKNRIDDEGLFPASGLVVRDDDGRLRFRADLQRVADVMSALDAAEITDDESRAEILRAFETVFDHRSATGRSQTMHGYEGLGSIYWHMATKLVHAAQERVQVAIAAGISRDEVQELATLCHRLRDGLGYRKAVAIHGAFPMDPHSHTPADRGAQQPGMTGAVKDAILIRWSELGVDVSDGQVHFSPLLLDASEFITAAEYWAPLGDGAQLPADSLGFTYCAVPIVYSLTDASAATTVHWSDGRVTHGEARLSREASQALFARTGAIRRIDVAVPRAVLLGSASA